MSSHLTLKSTIKLSSGFELPLIGLGVFRNVECKPACLAALKNGYIHIDTARMYENEVPVGEAVRESGIPREEIFITSKVDSPEHGYQSTIAAVDNSLQNFQFDYIDLMLLHSPLSGKEKRLEAWKALIEARNQGKIRSIGVSNFVKHLEEIQGAGLETPAVNQLEIHPFCQQKPIVEYCAKHDIIVEGYAPLVRGKWNDLIVNIGRKYNKDPAQILVRWSLQRGFVPLPKSAHAERVKSNGAVYDFEISAEDIAAIDALDQGQDGAVTWNPINAE